MEDIKRCSRCILPVSLSNITFDSDGVCNHCRKYEFDFKDWELIKERKKTEFEKILEKAKRLKRPYDVLVPLSGGKRQHICSLSVYKELWSKDTFGYF